MMGTLVAKVEAEVRREEGKGSYTEREGIL